MDKSEIERRYTKGTGAGGQRKNKVETCVVLTHKPTGISVRIDGRDRGRNEAEAWKVLKERLQRCSDKNYQDNLDSKRKNQIGTGNRGDKRRTYRVKDDIVIDHITNKKASLKEIQKGNLAILWK